MHTVALLLLLSPHLADGASLARWLDKTCGAGGELSRVGVQCDIMEATFCTGAGSSSVQYSCDANGMTKTEFRDTTSCGEDLPETCAGLPLPCTTQDEVDALVVYNNSGYENQCIYFGPEDYRTFSCDPCAAYATTYSLVLTVAALAFALRAPEWF